MCPQCGARLVNGTCPGCGYRAPAKAEIGQDDNEPDLRSRAFIAGFHGAIGAAAGLLFLLVAAFVVIGLMSSIRGCGRSAKADPSVRVPAFIARSRSVKIESIRISPALSHENWDADESLDGFVFSVYPEGSTGSHASWPEGTKLRTRIYINSSDDHFEFSRGPKVFDRTLTISKPEQFSFRVPYDTIDYARSGDYKHCQMAVSAETPGGAVFECRSKYEVSIASP